jgi:hypothetical protein
MMAERRDADAQPFGHRDERGAVFRLGLDAVDRQLHALHR